MVDVPQVFTTQPGAAVANFSYTDIASGLGYVIYLPGNSSGSGSDGAGERVLSANEFYASPGYIKTAASGAYTFDSVFNLPRVARGKTIVSVPCVVARPAGGVASGNAEYFININKIALDTTETILCSGTYTLPYSLNSAGTKFAYGQFVFVSDMQQTQFKKGETLRYKIWMPVGGANLYTLSGCDPKGRSTNGAVEDADLAGISWGTTARAEIHVSFIVDLT